MSVVGKINRTMFVILGVFLIIGLIVLTIIFPKGILGFGIGMLITAINILITNFAFGQLYSNSVETGKKAHVLLAGPLPKLFTIFGGGLVCKNFLSTSNTITYIIGVCIYVLVFFVLAVLDYLRIKKTS